MTVTIDIDMNKKCAECRKPGAVASGICLSCVTKAFYAKPLKSAEGRAVQQRMRSMKKDFGASR